jgi:putative acetyltransferase
MRADEVVFQIAFSNHRSSIMIITHESPNQPDIVALLDQLDAYCGGLYPAESNHLMDIASLMLPGVVFLVARDDGGRAAGCGAFVERGDYAEVKRMFVDPSLRGQGAGARLLADIARRASAAGITCLRLETGIYQPEAIGLYERSGFVRCAPFGEYQPDPLSLFMERAL